MRQTREMYVSPLIEVIEIENEGVIATSANTGSSLPNITDGGSAYRTNSSRATQSDIESLIEDIFTIEQ